MKKIAPFILPTVALIVSALSLTQTLRTQHRLDEEEARAARRVAAQTHPAVAAATRAAWDEITQEQVDGLTDDLRKLVKLPVTIFCDDTARCGNVALNFENAFETARWQVGIRKPFFPHQGFGVLTNSRDLAVAIEKVTRLPVSLTADSGALYVSFAGKP